MPSGVKGSGTYLTWLWGPLSESRKVTSAASTLPDAAQPALRLPVGARRGRGGARPPARAAASGRVGGLHAIRCERTDLTLGDVRRPPRPCSHQPGTLTTIRLGPGNRPSLPRHEESKPLCRARFSQTPRGPGRSWEAVRTGGHNWPPLGQRRLWRRGRSKSVQFPSPGTARV